MFDSNKGNQTCGGEGEGFVQPSNKTSRDLEVQLVLALILGVSAFITFCILRPRWPSLYAARKRRLNPDISLPALPDSFFGWIPRLYKVTEEQVLAAAGLDAFVFLAFFKMAIRLFALMAFFALVILTPINAKFASTRWDFGGNQTNGNYSHNATFDSLSPIQLPLYDDDYNFEPFKGDGHKNKPHHQAYLWSYVLFTYFYVALTLYSINWETFRILRFRQDYLGTQSTVTDRTFRLTGIPSDLRSEGQIKHLIEKLDIGAVDTVVLCRVTKELDKLVEQRDKVLRKLETAWARFIENQREFSKKKNKGSNQSAQDNHGSLGNGQDGDRDEEAGEGGGLLGISAADQETAEDQRPDVIIRYGLFGIHSRKTDAIDYYEEKLRRLDEKIVEARKKDYAPTDMALVTMDSVAACQMVIQARIDPRPSRLLTKSTPSPSDFVWKNTYAPRGLRRLKSWGVTIFITFLTLLWIFPTAFLASLLSICTIRQAIPSFAEWLSKHAIIYSLVQNGIPTLVVSLLNVAVPYVYDWLSNCQGMISQGDVELSVISKNFFFIFFNTFFVFAVSLTGFDFFSTLQGFLKDTSAIPMAIAHDVEQLSKFYISYIILQGVGLMPFRILEVGTVFLYPIYRVLSKTPRDFKELEKPSVFQYGFYLPTALLVFNLCLIYSILNWGFAILIFGTIYFTFGYFTFKYMVLYAMDQPQHATGGAWRIICYRIIVGLLVFEVVMIGLITIRGSFVQSVFNLPLLPFTIWYSVYFKRRYEPLTRNIALRAIRSDQDAEDSAALDEAFEAEGAPRPSQGLLRRGSTLDEHREKGLTFVNPSLVVPLEQPWIYQDPPPPLTTEDTDASDEQSHRLILPNADSSLGIGEDNVWSDNGRSNS